GQLTPCALEQRIETFDVILPTRKDRVVEPTAPTRFTARPREPALREDATSSQAAEQPPVYNAYSIAGDVEAPLVYENYGVPDDYEALERDRVDVEGNVVIAPYGAAPRARLRH